MRPKMDWSTRHLNWTWVIAVGIASIILTIFPILLFFAIQMINIGVIEAKNRSMRWIFPSFVIFFLPLLLRNKTIKETPIETTNKGIQ